MLCQSFLLHRIVSWLLLIDISKLACFYPTLSLNANFSGQVIHKKSFRQPIPSPQSTQHLRNVRYISQIIGNLCHSILDRTSSMHMDLPHLSSSQTNVLPYYMIGYQTRITAPMTALTTLLRLNFVIYHSCIIYTRT